MRMARDGVVPVTPHVIYQPATQPSKAGGTSTLWGLHASWLSQDHCRTLTPHSGARKGGPDASWAVRRAGRIHGQRLLLSVLSSWGYLCW